MRVINRRDHRRGFTLIELLVVISIIAVLGALAVAAVVRFVGTGPGAATRANLGKIRAALNNQVKAVGDQARRDEMAAANNSAYLARALNAGNGATDPRVRTAYVRLRQTQACPTTIAEAFWPDTGSGLTGTAWKPGTPVASAPNAWQPYVNYLAGFGITPANEATGISWGSLSPDVQNSICLLMILEVGPNNTSISADDLGRTTVAGVPISSSQAARGIVDGWRHPVTFKRGGASGVDITLTSAGNDGKFNTADDINVDK